MAGAVLLTRPEPSAHHLQTSLALRGIAALRAPVLTLRAVATPRPDGGTISGILFTSAAAVQLLPYEALPEGWAAWPCYCVGNATAHAAAKAGWHNAVSADGDGAVLAALALAQRPAPQTWLHPCGMARRDEPGVTLRAHGHMVLDWEVYDAVAATDLPAQAVAALRDQHCAAALFYSPRSAEVYARLLTAAGFEATASSMTAWCLSPQIAKAASVLRWRAVRTASAPEEAALLTGLQNWLRQEKMQANFA